jgi:hypothetical protein
MFIKALQDYLDGQMLDGENNNGNNETPPENNNGNKGESNSESNNERKFEWTKEQQDEINRIAAETRREAAEKARRELEAENERKRQQEEEKREQEEAVKRGEFDKVKGALESKLQEAEGKVEALSSENEILRKFYDSTIKAELDDMPDFIKEFDPGEEASIEDRFNWFEKARVQTAKYYEQQGQKPRRPGNRTPKTPSAPNNDDIRQQARRELRRKSPF